MDYSAQTATPAISNDRPSYVEGPGEMAPIRPDRIRPIQIEQLDRGYVVQVGCQRIVIVSASELISSLATYISSPNDTERRYNEGKLL